MFCPAICEQTGKLKHHRKSDAVVTSVDNDYKAGVECTIGTYEYRLHVYGRTFPIVHFEKTDPNIISIFSK